jgi:hypothetical protein
MRYSRSGARMVAWGAFVLGVVASVAANGAHARPEVGPRLASAFAPVALLLTVEIMSRVPWPRGRSWALGRWAGTGAVALVAAVTSYRHMSALLVSYGEDQLTALIQPLCVDGLMVVASLALLALGANDSDDRKRTTAAMPARATVSPNGTRPSAVVGVAAAPANSGGPRATADPGRGHKPDTAPDRPGATS